MGPLRVPPLRPDSRRQNTPRRPQCEQGPSARAQARSARERHTRQWTRQPDGNKKEQSHGRYAMRRGTATQSALTLSAFPPCVSRMRVCTPSAGTVSSEMNLAPSSFPRVGEAVPVACTSEQLLVSPMSAGKSFFTLS